MIVFDLVCPKGHCFESWFKDGAAYDQQVSAGHVACPACGSTDIKKALMAPNLSGTKKKEETPPQPQMTKKAALEMKQAAELRENLKKIRQSVEENFDYVGRGFAEEARKIHYGETEARNIYGETSDEEAKALTEEGVDVARIPWIEREDS